MVKHLTLVQHIIIGIKFFIAAETNVQPFTRDNSQFWPICVKFLYCLKYQMKLVTLPQIYSTKFIYFDNEQTEMK